MDFRSEFGLGGCYLLMQIIKKSTGFDDVVATGTTIKLNIFWLGSILFICFISSLSFDISLAITGLFFAITVLNKSVELSTKTYVSVHIIPLIILKITHLSTHSCCSISRQTYLAKSSYEWLV